MPTIVTRHSTVPTIAPSAGQLLVGELAVNVTDRKLYTLDGSNNVVLIASGGSSPTEPFSIIVNSASPALTLTNNGSGQALYVTAGDVDIQTSISFRVNDTAKEITWGLSASTDKTKIVGREGLSGYLAFQTDDTERIRITRTGAVSFGNTGTSYGSLGDILISQGNAPPAWTSQFTSLSFVFSGAGSPIMTGFAGDLQIPFASQIVEATLVADQAGSIVIGISKAPYATFPGSLASIVGSSPPTLTAAQKSTDTTLTGWTTSIAAGDILRFSVTSASAVTSVTLSLKLIRV
jgi:hypothetical protein